MAAIQRKLNGKIVREASPKEKVREEFEIQAAKRMGNRPNEMKEMFRDVYEFYQNNEC